MAITKAREVLRISVCPKVLVEQYLEYIEKVDKLVLSTVKNRRHILVPFFRQVIVNDITKLTIYDIDEYIANKIAKKSTMNIERQAFRGFFQYCAEYKELPLSFNWQVIRRTKDRPPKVVTFTKDQVNEVIQGCKQPQDKLMIAMMFETGMRIGEIINLRIEDVRGEQIQVRGKGEADRPVYLTPGLSKILRQYVAERRIIKGCVFRPLQPQRNYPPDAYVSAYGVRDRIERAFNKCGHDMHPHQLRHSFAIHWLECGGDIRTLQKIMGHANIETTMRYLDITDKFTESIYKKTFSTSVISI